MTHAFKAGDTRTFTYSMPEGGTGGEHDHLRERNGQQVTVLEVIDSDEVPCYKVGFPDGFGYDAFEDEIDGTHE